jgi:hypothetical protein
MLPLCHAGLDRFQFLAQPLSGNSLPEFLGFRRRRDSFVRSQTSVKTYARRAEYIDQRAGVRIFLQHEPCLPNLAPFKLTLVPDDRRLLTLDLLSRVVSQFAAYRLLLVEVAFDFSAESGVDLTFTRQHAVFGKSHRDTSRSYDGRDIYGARKSAKLVRCYRKSELNSFRIELEVHSEWLRRYNICTLQNLARLPRSICPSHMRFVQLDWPALSKHLVGCGLDAEQIIRQMKAAKNPIHEKMLYLRATLQIRNVHRFVVTTAQTQLIVRALKNWARSF